MKPACLIALCLSLAACQQSADPRASAQSEADANGAGAPANKKAQPPLDKVVDTGSAITGLSIVPAQGHRGEAKLAVAHGKGGAAIYDLAGNVIWADGKPAALAVFTNGELLLYREGEPGGRVDKYRQDGSGALAFVDSAQPAVPAATTLQRTALAAIGPVRFEGKTITLQNYGTIEADEEVTAVAGAKLLIPLSAGKVIAYSTTSGKIHIVNVPAGGAEGE